MIGVPSMLLLVRAIDGDVHLSSMTDAIASKTQTRIGIKLA